MDDGVSGLSGSVIKSPIFQGRTSIQGQALYRALCEADSPDSKCPGCFASLRSEQGAGLACRLGRCFKAFHALRSPPETRAPLRRYAAIPAHFVGGAIYWRKRHRPQSFEYVPQTVYRFFGRRSFLYLSIIFKEVMHHAQAENHPGAGS